MRAQTSHITTTLTSANETDDEVVDAAVSSEQRAFWESLRTSGLVKMIKSPARSTHTRRPLVQVQGEPLSVTIVAERR